MFWKRGPSFWNRTVRALRPKTGGGASSDDVRDAEDAKPNGSLPLPDALRRAGARAAARRKPANGPERGTLDGDALERPALDRVGERSPRADSRADNPPPAKGATSGATGRPAQGKSRCGEPFCGVSSPSTGGLASCEAQPITMAGRPTPARVTGRTARLSPHTLTPAPAAHDGAPRGARSPAVHRAASARPRSCGCSTVAPSNLPTASFERLCTRAATVPCPGPWSSQARPRQAHSAAPNWVRGWWLLCGQRRTRTSLRLARIGPGTRNASLTWSSSQARAQTHRQSRTMGSRSCTFARSPA